MKTKLKELPEWVQSQVINALGAFNEVQVFLSDNEYIVRTESTMLSDYPDDNKLVGVFVASEILTRDERIIAFVNNFRNYPPEYEGIIDYNILTDGEQLYFEYLSQGGVAPSDIWVLDKDKNVIINPSYL